MQFDYFYQEESENYAFYRTPKVLCTDKRFQGLSSDAKLLYGILLDVINVGGYIGDSTKSEIEYAKAHGKEVHYLEE